MRLTAWLWGLFLAWPALAADARAEQPIPSEAIDKLVQQSIDAWQVPGVAVGIVHKGKVIYLKGHGVRSQAGPAPVMADTLFPIASCTKAFTTTLLAQLVDEGKLSWDDHPRKHVRCFQLADPLADRAVTLRDLLCHRTGLAGHEWLWHHAPWSLEDGIRRAGLLPLDQPFRSAFQYQSTMFTVAGLAAAQAGGAPWETLIRQRLLEPLGMERTVCTSREAQDKKNLATGHELTPSGDIATVEGFFMEKANPAGSIYSSASDLCNWLRFHLAEGKFNGRALVSAHSLGETSTPQMVIPMDWVDRHTHSETVQLSYGMGWVIHDYRGRSLRSHAGAIDGFRVHITLVPEEDLGLVLLNNLDRTQMNQALCNRLLDRLLNVPRKDCKNWDAELLDVRRAEARRQAEAQRREVRQPDTKPSRPLADYAGVYEHPAFGPVTIALKGETLTWAWNKERAPLEHWQFDAFTAPHPMLRGTKLNFQLDRTGRVAALQLEGRIRLELRRK